MLLGRRDAERGDAIGDVVDQLLCRLPADASLVGQPLHGVGRRLNRRFEIAPEIADRA